MIAIESLLTRQGDKYSDALPKRIEAFLGWSGYWSINGYEDRIHDLDRKRCELVHAGRLDLIEIKWEHSAVVDQITAIEPFRVEMSQAALDAEGRKPCPSAYRPC
jgi:hypothetical protein